MKKYLSAVMMVIMIVITIHSYSQETPAIKQKTINVSGSAEMEIVPDEIYVQVQLQEYDLRGAGKANIENIKNEFLKSALSVGIPEKDISVQSFTGWDDNNWWYRKNRKRDPDMKASITYEVKVGSTKKLDDLVKKLDDEATENFSISRVSHSKIQEYKKQLKIQAVMAAREKANYLAEAINEKAGEALTINEPMENMPYPPVIYANRMVAQAEVSDGGGGDAPVNVDFKKMKLKFEVNVVFSLK